MSITIPSPSAFLRSPVLQPTAPSINSKPASKRQVASSKTYKSSTIGTDGVTKPKQSKSRNGCVTCKAKRLKCDEIKPSCQQCHKRNVTCGGYKKDFKWRSFEEAAFTSKPAPRRTRKASISIKAEKFDPSSRSISETSGSTVGIGISFANSAQNVHPPQLSSMPLDRQLQPRSYPPLHHEFAPNPSSYTAHGSQYPAAPRSYQSNFQNTTVTSTLNGVLDDTNTVASSMTRASSLSSGQSPRLIDLLLPGTDLNAPPLDYMNYPPQQSDVPYQPGGYPSVQQEVIDQDDDVEEIVRQPDPAEAWIMRLPSPSPSNSSTSSSDGSHLDPCNSIYGQPKLHPGSPEMLMLGFDRQTCGILSVKDGPTENPWRTLVWPLARDSPALYHAISSMTAFHSTKLKPEMKVEGMEHMRRSIRHLAAGIENMRTDTALATTLALAFSESWDVHVKTGIEHLRGAKVLVSQALTKHKQNSLTGDDLTRLKFLCNTWVYMDVIARLTSIDDDETTDFDSALWSGGSFMTTATEVDPLMGCASTLFPLIGRVANLVRKVRKSRYNTPNIISQASELKGTIEQWQPAEYFEAPEDPTSNIDHSLQTAEAYRWATLLYLHQAVPEIPSETAAKLADKVLSLLATVPLSSRAIIVHIYPLLAAGCEATGQELRAWVEDRWTSMSQRMLIGNIDRCLEVVREVWKRRDKDEVLKIQQQNSRRTASRRDSGYTSPMLSMKRACTAEEQDSMDFLDWCGNLGGGKRRATLGELGMPVPMNVNPSKKQSMDIVENVDFDRTVRGRSHWVGVMKDWGWEVLLG